MADPQPQCPEFRSCDSTSLAVENLDARAAVTKKSKLKLDTEDDRRFYELPRFETYVDDNFLKQLTQLYRQRIPAGSVVLDLMSSWVSHLPKDVTYSRVIGHGLNAAELGRNPQLTEFFVRDLNQDPDGWAVADESVDAVVCCVSVQYMQQPERVFTEILRVLKPGGVCIMAFSNLMWTSKAIQAWRDNTMFGRVKLVRQYFACAEGFTETEFINKVELGSSGPGSGMCAPGMCSAFACLRGGDQADADEDPFCAVISYRDFKQGLVAVASSRQ